MQDEVYYKYPLPSGTWSSSAYTMIFFIPQDLVTPKQPRYSSPSSIYKKWQMTVKMKRSLLTSDTMPGRVLGMPLYREKTASPRPMQWSILSTVSAGEEWSKNAITSATAYTVSSPRHIHLEQRAIFAR